jgi:hypothetical protein
MNTLRTSPLTFDETAGAGTTDPFELDRPKFTPDDLCVLTGWSRPTLWRHLATLPHSRVGRFVRFSERQLREILSSFERRPPSKEERS